MPLSASNRQANRPPWRILIVDDDDDIHVVTRHALADLHFDGVGVEWLSAHSAREARDLVRRERDIAIVFLDLVMETDSAGLDFMKWFREENISPGTRVILRTGLSQMPEKDIILHYDLHDYKTKEELSPRKLYVSTISALRAYRDMQLLDHTRIQLEGLVQSTHQWVSARSLAEFAGYVLDRLERMFCFRPGGMFVAERPGEDADQLVFSVVEVRPGLRCGFDEARLRAIRASMGQKSFFGDGHTVLSWADQAGRRYAVYLEHDRPVEPMEKYLLSLMAENLVAGVSNLSFLEDLGSLHKATVIALADLAEFRDTDTGQHVLRLSRMADLLVVELARRGVYREELTPDFMQTLGLSVMLHDIGKVAIPDRILFKPGKLNEEEWAIMRTHAKAGGGILERAARLSGEKGQHLRMGANVANFHHERWDGTGYPHGLRGRAIPIEARITAIVDVWDALCSRRVYKEAFPLEECLRVIVSGRGKHFDPHICDVFESMVCGGEFRPTEPPPETMPEKLDSSTRIIPASAVLRVGGKPGAAKAASHG